MLTPDTVPLIPKDVVARREPGGVLLFQVETDEMYFVSESGFTLFSLSDGTRTVSEIEDLLATYEAACGLPAGRERIERLLEALAERRLVELWS